MNRNDTFNRLTFIKEVDCPAHLVKKERFGKFQCSCGKEVIARLSTVKKGHTKSCGCFQLDKLYIAQAANRGKFGESAKNYVLYQLKTGAKRRKLEFSLTDSEVLALTQSNCHYCDERPSMRRNGNSHYGEFIYNGIDRVDNQLGYTPANTVTCCIFCNRMKMAHTKAEFLAKVKKVYEHLQLASKDTPPPSSTKTTAHLPPIPAFIETPPSQYALIMQ